MRENLELSFVQEAEMVFTTLSSTGRRIFSRLENAFENVLVDEAAQASEIAVLQPLTLGCTRYFRAWVEVNCLVFVTLPQFCWYHINACNGCKMRCTQL